MRSRKIAILSVAIIYGLLSFLLFSETLITQLIELRKAYYVSESQNFEHFEFNMSTWKKLQDKKEFIYKGDYYDIKKTSITGNSVSVTVIKDEYENILKYIYKNISPKHKKQKGFKVKRIPEVYISKLTIDIPIKPDENPKHNYFYLSRVMYPHATSIFRPPCLM